METPKSARQLRPPRIPTPRLSERKKSLFATSKEIHLSGKGKGVDEEEEENDDLLQGITRLVSNTSASPKKNKSYLGPLRSSKKCAAKAISFFEWSPDGPASVDDGNSQRRSDTTTTPTRRSLRLNEKNNSPSSAGSPQLCSTTNGKENNPMHPRHVRTQALDGNGSADEQLQKLFSDSLRLNGASTATHSPTPTPPNGKSFSTDVATASSSTEAASKRLHADTSSGLSPQRKVAKVQTFDSGGISTKAFYSTMASGVVASATRRGQVTPTVASPQRSRRVDRGHYSQPTAAASAPSINKGVRHKIRRRPRPPTRPGGHPCRPPVDIDAILSCVRNEKLHKLIAAKREERIQIEKAHSSFRTGQNPITMARPLSSLSLRDDGGAVANDDSNHNNNNVENKVGKHAKPRVSPSATMSTSSFPQSAVHDAETDFSDIDYDSDDSAAEDWRMGTALAEEQVIPLISHQPTDLIHLDANDDVSPHKNRSTTPTNRKFFKSGRSNSTRMEVKITDNIRASVCNGKISLVQEKQKKSAARKRNKIRNSIVNEFSDEQATVDAILKNLDDTAFGDVLDTAISVEESSEQLCMPAANNNDQQQFEIIDDSDAFKDIQLQDHTDYAEFRRRLPFETSDSEIIEQQHLLLDFLISNNICTEENFTIFIADPDNHKEQAARIVNQVIVVVNEQTDFRQRLPFNTCDPAVIEQQHSFLDFLIEHNICSEENFDIFIANYEQRMAEAEAIVVSSVQSRQQDAEPMDNMEDVNDCPIEDANKTDQMMDNIVEDQNCNILIEEPNLHPSSSGNNLDSKEKEQEKSAIGEATCQRKSSQTSDKLFPIFYGSQCQPLTRVLSTRVPPRSWNGGMGSTQYQIDAGQKRFGAQQCKQCGLVYTVHEPEEEKLHRDYHASLHVLRFKGWIDEDIVSIYTEWGPDGRILRITESSHPMRRVRLMDILKIVDKELGFASYIIPKTFVAYLAVRKHQIVGLCLVQPLQKANKYVCIDGLDCCTEEEFEAKCGISRIWVSPLHRRLRIAYKLIQAVQLNTIFGEELSLETIAFSAPTESGKIFAQKVTKTENFLVYQ